MTSVWTLPGPARFLERIERALRDGTSVVVRFPGRAPFDFRERTLSPLYGSWRCTVVRPEPSIAPVESLSKRFAPRLSSAWGATLLDLCEHEDFHGRIIWLDGLDSLTRNDWTAWKKFLADYAQASRSVREFERTVFVAVLEGVPPADPPQEDVTLSTYDWSGTVEEMDLLFLSHARLFERDAGPLLRSLLATTVARVAAWDPEMAERLLDEKDEVILNPGPMLQSVAREKGWTTETGIGWEFGTASGGGVLHAALASLEEPPRELQRRVWSAQTSVLLPVIDECRRDIVLEHRALLAHHLSREGNRADPLDLDIGDLTGMVQRPGFDQDVRRRLRELNRWRNDLAHLKPLSTPIARLLAAR